jgi:DNA-binding SARP family transcriptional activator/tetratricopeptide (TPR) repeat protein
LLEGTLAMQFHLLGKPELWADGRRHSLGPRKERHVLAVLLLELPRPVSVETLADRVWEEGSSDGTYNSLYSVVSRLRKRLGSASGVDGEKLLPKRSGVYALQVNRDDVDVWRFRALRDEAKKARFRDDELAVALYDQAEALWHGVPLHGLDGGWAESVRATLNEERLAATVQRIGSRLELGHHADLVSELAGLVHEYPDNDRLLRLYLTALYGSGRQAEALLAYARAENRWRKDFGLTFGRDLQDLQRLMLHGDPVLNATASFEPPSRQAAVIAETASPPAPPSALPRDDSDFSGRTTELKRLAGWMTPERPGSPIPVIVISGLPGIGKTELAVHAARVFGDQDSAQLFVELHTPDGNPVEPRAALGTLLQELGVSDRVIPGSVEGRVALWRSLLADKRALVVLDNAADSAQVRPLLPGAADCCVLVTTRRKSIDLPGMRWLPLEPLPPAEAAELFSRTSGEGRRDDEAGVAAVLRLCGYLPQEIHFAASQLRRHPAWSIGELTALLQESPAADREVGVGLELTYRHLTPASQRLLRHLTLHPGPDFSQHAAVTLSESQSLGETRGALEILLDYDLIGEMAPGRYVFRDVVWKYARWLAGERDSTADRNLAIDRLLDYYLYLADQADRLVYPFHRRIPFVVRHIPASAPPLKTRGDCLKQMAAERTSLLAVARYAASQGRNEHASLLAHALARFLDAWGYWAEARELHELAITAWRAMRNSSGEAKALTELSLILGRMGRHDDGLRQASDALAIARAAADRAAEADALDRIGIVLWWMARYPEAIARFDEALSIWRALGDEDGEADTLMYSGIVAWHLSSYPDALRRIERALALYRQLGDAQGEANGLNNLGELQYEAGEYDRALGSYQHALAMYKDLGDRQGEAIAVNNIGNACRETGRSEDALACYRAALGVFRDIGDLRCEAETLNSMGTAYLRIGRHGDALEQHYKALVLANQLAERFLTAESLNGSGSAHLAGGSYSLAAEDFRTAIEISKQIGDRNQEAQALTGLGDALLHTEGRAAAEECWSPAATIFQGIGKLTDAEAVRTRLRMHDT